MKMQAHFFLDDENETSIMSMYDLTSAPFNVGDKISLDIEELYPNDVSGYKPEVRMRMIKDNNELRQQFRHKTIEILRRGNYARFNTHKAGTMTFEYHCKIVED